MKVLKQNPFYRKVTSLQHTKPTCRFFLWISGTKMVALIALTLISGHKKDSWEEKNHGADDSFYNGYIVATIRLAVF